MQRPREIMILRACGVLEYQGHFEHAWDIYNDIGDSQCSTGICPVVFRVSYGTEDELSLSTSRNSTLTFVLSPQLQKVHII